MLNIQPIDHPRIRRFCRVLGYRLQAAGKRLIFLADKAEVRNRHPGSWQWLPNLEPNGQAMDDRWRVRETQMLRLTIAAVAYQQPQALQTFLSCMRCQTLQNFRLHILHDGPHEESRIALQQFEQAGAPSIETTFSEKRYNDWGHTLRSLAIEQAETEFILVTNADNYYSPKMVEYAFDVIDAHQLDLLHFNMIHSHDGPGGRRSRSYQPFETLPITQNIDIGAFIVRTRIARQVGFCHRGFDADGRFLEDLLKSGLLSRVGHMNKTLLMHN